MKIKIILLYLVMLVLSACNGRNGSFDVTKPLSLDMRPPAGPVNYQAGWSDGCESSLTATNTKLQIFLGTHEFTLHPQLRNDPLYKQAWRYGYLHCGYSMKSMARYNYL